jgi:hypothetical protein
MNPAPAVAAPRPFRVRLISCGFGFRNLVFLWMLVGGCWSFPVRVFAQAHVEPEKPLDPAAAIQEAHQLISEIVSQVPDPSTNSGMIHIRDADDHEREVTVRFSTLATPTNWLSIYETVKHGPATGSPDEKLTVIHVAERPNQYMLSNPAPRQLSPTEVMRPFAGSDFWIADLGLEFLYWPQQRLLKKEMRRSRFCLVLESTNPKPTPNGYSRVVCWITSETPHGIVHADAYDAHNKVLKRFDPTEFKKVEGQWQLEGMEIRNLKSGSQTLIKFDLR